MPGSSETSSAVESEGEVDLERESDREDRFRNEVRREELYDEELLPVRG